MVALRVSVCRTLRDQGERVDNGLLSLPDARLINMTLPFFWTSG